MSGLDNMYMRPPIFICSAGWRSGSTLLQRMITASHENLIWGEAGGALNHMADAWQGYKQMLGEGNVRFKFGYGGNGLKQYQAFVESGDQGIHKWIASMNPPEETILKSFRNFFEQTYLIPAKKLGYNGWGIKEVQSGIETANFLKLIYPQAKFIFLIRHPISCLLSIKRRNWLGESDTRYAVEFYAKHWAMLANEFRQADYGLIITYEKLISQREELEKIKSYLGLNNLEYQFSEKSRADWKASNNSELSFFERRRILKIASEEMKAYDYI